MKFHSLLSVFKSCVLRCSINAVLLVTISFCSSAHADILLNFNDGSTNPSTADPNLSLTLIPHADAFFGVNPAIVSGTLVVLADDVGAELALDGQDFHKIELTVGNLGPEQTLDIESFSFGWGADNPLTFDMATFSSVTGFGSNLELASYFTPNFDDVPPSNNLIAVDVSATGFSGLQNGDKIEFRIYFWDQSGSDGRRHLLDDIQIVTSVSGDPPPGQHYQVYLLGGQSNGLGFGDPRELPPALQSPQTDVLFYSDQLLSAPNTLTGLQPGSGSNTRFGPEVTFGRSIADAFPDQNFAIIKHSPGGTSLSFHWDPTPETTDISNFGPAVQEGAVYVDFQNVVDNGLAALHAQGHTTEIVGMLWTQGESDTVRRLAYVDLLDEFIADVRSRYGADLPFFLSEMSPNQLDHRAGVSPEAGFDGIRSAQQLVAAGDLNAYLIQTVGPDFPAPDIHFRTVGQMNLGEAFARAVIDLKPELIVNGNFEVPFVEADADDNTFNGFANADEGLFGWEVSGDGFPVLINGFDGLFDVGDEPQANVDSVPSSGVNFLQLQARGNATTISQTITTVVGQEYTLSFAYGALDFGSRELSIAYQISTDEYTVDLTSTDIQIPWATETRTFVATEATTTISFTGDGFSGFWGASIDNVSVSPVAAMSLLGDFDLDGDVDLADLDQYNGNIGAIAEGDLAILDLDGDGTVELGDLVQHYSTLVETSNGQAGTFAGDTNLDGTVDVLNDAFALISNLGSPANSWSEGDLNADEMVDVLGDAFALIANLGRSNQ